VSRGRGAGLALAAALTLAPGLAGACAVCGAGAEERSNVTFLISTIFLSLLPLAAIGGALWWLRRHARERLAGEFIDRDDLRTAAPGPAAEGSRG